MKATKEAAATRGARPKIAWNPAHSSNKGTRYPVTQRSHRHEEEVHCKARPYQQTCFLESPHLTNTVIDDVRDGENDESTRQ